MSVPLPAAVVADLHARSQAATWGLTREAFAARIAASVAYAFPDRTPSESEIATYTAALHLDDLALAAACTAGIEAAWAHFIAVCRPALYRAADALEPGGGARDLADSLYADLYGLSERDGTRQSLLRHFHGRSTLLTWLRAVLSQRYVDQVRARRRVEPLPDEDAPAPIAAPQPSPDPDRPRLAGLVIAALTAAIAALEPRDRLRLRCYYAQDMTLAAIGRMMREHEATASRHLTRTRRTIRDAIAATLRRDHGLDDRAVGEAMAAIVEDSGMLDVQVLVGAGPERKKSGRPRST